MCCTAGAQGKPSLGLSPEGADNLNSSPEGIRLSLPLCAEMETSAQQGYFFTSPNKKLLLFGQSLDAFQLFHFHRYLDFNLSCLCNGIQSAIYWMNIYEGSDEEADSECICHSLATTRAWPLLHMQPS